MLDLKFIRTNPELLKRSLIRRGEINLSDPKILDILSDSGIGREKSKASLELLLKKHDQIEIEKVTTIRNFDEERRNSLFQVEQLKANRNKVSMEIAAKKKAGEPTEELISGMKKVSDQIKVYDEKIASIDSQLEEFLLTIPNIPHDSVPIGIGDLENPERERFGSPKKFSFPVKAHVDLGTKLGILDLERAGKIAGARLSVLMRKGAQLERAIISFMLDLHTREHGYSEVAPPLMVNSSSMRGTGQLPKFETDLFKLQNTDYYLIPTAEVPLTNLFSGEILGESELTIKFVAYTPCFRSEAGSYGKDTRGLIRLHQFDKVELVKFCRPDRSYEELESLLTDASKVLKLLGIPFRIVTLSTGDLGFAAAKTYDIEVWLPSQNTYREISSCSNFEDFQARRANIRFKGDGKGAKTAYVHTLNGSGLAVGRTWVAILENFQDESGKIFIPEPLRPYMGGATHLE
ncbi:serine--tRNA ligase [bacterium]|nr:serine--tRNA ligase [bacterium]